MPRIATDTVAGILERVILQSVDGNPNAERPGDEAVAVARHQVREPLAQPEVPMEPKASAHGVNHPVAPLAELDPFELQSCDVPQWRNRRKPRIATAGHRQVMTPSAVAGAAGAMLPLNIAQVSGYESGCVAIADHPPTVAPMIVNCTPLVVLKLSNVVSVV